MNTIQEFKNNKYVHLKNFLDKNSCQQLKDELKRLVNENKTVKDEQCPLSDAVHGSEIFDSFET